MTPLPQLSISAVFAEMRDRARESSTVLIRVTLVFAVLNGAAVLLELGGTVGLAFSFGLSVLFGAAYRGMAAALVCLPDPKESAGEVWAQVRPFLATLVWTSLLLTVAVLVGFIGLLVPAVALLSVLLIPGVIFLVMWSVAIPAIVAENLSVSDSLGRSTALVRGNGWKVFGFLMLLGIAGGVVLLLIYAVTAPLGGGIAFGVVFQFLVTCLLLPLTAVGPAALYNVLTAPPEAPPEGGTPREQERRARWRRR